MHFVAFSIISGAIDYRDIFDINMPVIHWIHWSIITNMGSGDLAWRLFDLCWLSATCVVIVLTMLPVGGLPAFLAASFVALYHLSGGAEAMGQRDFLMLLPICGFAFVYSLALQEPRQLKGRVLLATAGILLGLATFMKPTSILLFIPFAIHLFWRRASYERGFSDFAIFASGGIAMAIIVTIVLAATDSLGAFILIQRDFVLPIYSEIPGAPIWQTAPAFLLIFVPVAASVRILSLRQTGPSTGIALIYLVLLIFGILHFFIQHKFWSYHLYPFAVFGIVSGLVAFQVLSRETHKFWQSLGSLGLVLVLGLIGVRYVGLDKGRQILAGTAWRGTPIVDQLVNDLNAFRGLHVQPIGTADGTIHALYLSQMRLPTPYMYSFSFFLEAHREARDAARKDLLARLELAKFPPIILTKEQWPSKLGYEEILESWPELGAYLASSYRLVVEREFGGSKGYRIYVKRNQSS